MESVKVDDPKTKKVVHPKDLARQTRAQNKAKTWLMEQEMKEKGLDVQRERLKHYTAEEVELWNAKESKRKEFANPGFTDYNDMSMRKYERQMKNFVPDPSIIAESSVASASAESSEIASSTYLERGKVAANPELVEKVAKELKAEETRRKQSATKRKFYNEDEDVTHINFKNELFNKKLARAYDKYTKDIKDSFERGSAV